MPSKPAGDSGSRQTVNTQSETKLPTWVDQAAQDTLKQAQDTSQNLMGPYTGPRVAPLTGDATGNIQGLQNLTGVFNPAFNYAQQLSQQGANYNPSQVNAGSLAGTDLSPYMNPFTQSVIDPSMQLLDQQRQMGNNQTADLASKTGAFGGSRQGVAEGVNNAQSALLGGQLGAQLNSANFSQAQQAAMADLNRSMTAQQSNQLAGLSGAGLRLNAANQIADLGTRQQQSWMTGLGGAQAGQTLQQQQGQQQLDAAQQLYGEQRQQPVDQLQILLSALRGVPYGQTQTQTQTGPGPTYNPAMQALGGLGAGVGILGGIGSLFAAPGASAASGLASLLPAAAAALPISDRTAKTDIRKIGKDEDTGLDLFAYRYKGDPKTYKKVVGPMAQDIAAKYPDAVRDVGGKLAVDVGALTETVGPRVVRNLGFGGG